MSSIDSSVVVTGVFRDFALAVVVTGTPDKLSLSENTGVPFPSAIGVLVSEGTGVAFSEGSGVPVSEASGVAVSERTAIGKSVLDSIGPDAERRFSSAILSSR